MTFESRHLVLTMHVWAIDQSNGSSLLIFCVHALAHLLPGGTWKKLLKGIELLMTLFGLVLPVDLVIYHDWCSSCFSFCDFRFRAAVLMETFISTDVHFGVAESWGKCFKSNLQPVKLLKVYGLHGELKHLEGESSWISWFFGCQLHWTDHPVVCPGNVLQCFPHSIHLGYFARLDSLLSHWCGVLEVLVSILNFSQRVFHYILLYPLTKGSVAVMICRVGVAHNLLKVFCIQRFGALLKQRFKILSRPHNFSNCRIESLSQKSWSWSSCLSQLRSMNLWSIWWVLSTGFSYIQRSLSHPSPFCTLSEGSSSTAYPRNFCWYGWLWDKHFLTPICKSPQRDFQFLGKVWLMVGSFCPSTIHQQVSWTSSHDTKRDPNKHVIFQAPDRGFRGKSASLCINQKFSMVGPGGSLRFNGNGWPLGFRNGRRFCFYLVFRFRHRIALATGLEHITLIRFSWRETRHECSNGWVGLESLISRFRCDYTTATTTTKPHKSKVLAKRLKRKN